MFGNMKLFLVLNRISHSFALLTIKMSWTLVNTRNKFHISTHPCIILYIIIDDMMIRDYDIRDTVES